MNTRAVATKRKVAQDLRIIIAEVIERRQMSIVECTVTVIPKPTQYRASTGLLVATSGPNLKGVNYKVI